MKIWIMVLFYIALGIHVSDAADYDMDYIDDYLNKWYRYAKGENSLDAELKDNKDRFETHLAVALSAKDKKAPARMVFYAVVQVGGYISVNSKLGKAVSGIVGQKFPLVKAEDGTESFFAGDLYFWWEKNKSNYTAFPLFEKWSNRDFAKNRVIPMYKITRKYQ